jgi:hypothetical protein
VLVAELQLQRRWQRVRRESQPVGRSLHSRDVQ